MVINEPGTYTLVYTATDECGNVAAENRTVIVKALGHFEGVEDISIGQNVPFDLSSGVTAYDGDGNVVPFTVSPSTIDTSSVGEQTVTYSADDFSVVRTITVEAVRTVLYTDGTFIINELDSDKSANIVSHGAETNVYSPFDFSHTYVFANANNRPWNANVASIIAVKIGSRISPTSTKRWFQNIANCTSMDLSKLDTSIAIDMSSMFQDCGSLTSLGLSNFNTGSVTNMTHMFSGCGSLTSLDLSNFNTGSVTNMSHMFRGCGSLTSLDLNNFNTGSITDMTYMFSGCGSLTSLDLNNFNTGSVTNMSSMFQDCSSLTSLDLNNFNTSIAIDMSSMFRGCGSLTSLDLSNFNTGSVTNMSSMFIDCGSLTSLDLSNFNTGSVTNMTRMFSGCSSLQTIIASVNFVVAQVTSSTNMFTNMSTNLVGGAGTVWSSSAPTNKTRAKIDGGTADPGYFTAA